MPSGGCGHQLELCIVFVLVAPFTTGCASWCAPYCATQQCHLANCQDCFSAQPEVAVPSLTASRRGQVLEDCKQPAVDCTLDFHGAHGKLYANGAPFDVKGANWYGSESQTGPPGGLHIHPPAWYFDFLSTHGFNAIRWLFNHESVLREGAPIASSKMRTGGPLKGTSIHTIAHAPELEGVTYLEMFLALANQAAERGLLIMLAAHRLDPSAWPGGGLWYSSRITEANVLESWTKVAAKLCGQCGTHHSHTTHRSTIPLRAAHTLPVSSSSLAAVPRLSATPQMEHLWRGSAQ